MSGLLREVCEGYQLGTLNRLNVEEVTADDDTERAHTRVVFPTETSINPVTWGVAIVLDERWIEKKDVFLRLRITIELPRYLLAYY